MYSIYPGTTNNHSRYRYQYCMPAGCDELCIRMIIILVHLPLLSRVLLVRIIFIIIIIIAFRLLLLYLLFYCYSPCFFLFFSLTFQYTYLRLVFLYYHHANTVPTLPIDFVEMLLLYFLFFHYSPCFFFFCSFFSLSFSFTSYISGISRGSGSDSGSLPVHVSAAERHDYDDDGDGDGIESVSVVVVVAVAVYCRLSEEWFFLNKGPKNYAFIIHNTLS